MSANIPVHKSMYIYVHVRVHVGQCVRQEGEVEREREREREHLSTALPCNSDMCADTNEHKSAEANSPQHASSTYLLLDPPDTGHGTLAGMASKVSASSGGLSRTMTEQSFHKLMLGTGQTVVRLVEIADNTSHARR